MGDFLFPPFLFVFSLPALVPLGALGFPGRGRRERTPGLLESLDPLLAFPFPLLPLLPLLPLFVPVPPPGASFWFFRRSERLGISTHQLVTANAIRQGTEHACSQHTGFLECTGLGPLERVNSFLSPVAQHKTEGGNTTLNGHRSAGDEAVV